MNVGSISCGDFFLSKPCMGTLVAVLIALLIIGSLALARNLRGVGVVPAGFMTAIGGFGTFCALPAFIALITLPPRLSPPPLSIEEARPVQEEESDEESVDFEREELPKNEEMHLKLEELRKKKAPPPAKVPPQECLYTLAFLAQKALPPDLFKEALPHSLSSNEELVALMKESETKRGEELYLLLAHTFLENLPALHEYIHSSTQAILLQDPTEEGRSKFKLINKQMRMILLFFMLHEPEKDESFRKYQSHLDESWGNRIWNFHNYKQPVYYFNKLKSFKEEKSDEVSSFISLFSLYRRHALLRLFPEKIRQVSKCNDVALNTLLQATWFHGTRALSTLNESDFTLIPTGWLHQIGHTSFFGEMQDGCKKDGVNSHALSGTYLDRVNWSINTYASQFQFHIEKEMHYINKFLNIRFDAKYRNYHEVFGEYHLEFTRAEVALKRYARWDQEGFQEKRELILKTLAHAKEVIEKIEKERPEEIFAWRNNYYSSKYESMVHSIAQIEAFMNAPLPAPLSQRQRENITKNFPAVLGSFTLLSQPVHYEDDTGEHLVEGTAQLGKDLQLLCVQKKDLKKARQWLQVYLPDANIEIYSFDQLKAAQEVNKKISPYLADIFSLKKLERVCLNH